MRSGREFDDALLKIKKARFLEVVKTTAKHIKVNVPEVKFWDCPDSSGNEIAHCHSDKNLICISEEQLMKSSDSGLEDTAMHEVEHLRDERDESNPLHSHHFYGRLSRTKTEMWQPPGGVVHIKSGEENKPIKKSTYRKPENECAYHFCRKTVDLSACDYCGAKYCSEHLEAFEPSMTKFGGTARDRYNLLQEGGHPCIEFAEWEKHSPHEKPRWIQRSTEETVEEIEANTEEEKDEYVEIKSNNTTLRVILKGKKKNIKGVEVVLMKGKKIIKTERTNEAGVAAMYDLPRKEYTVTINRPPQKRLFDWFLRKKQPSFQTQTALLIENIEEVTFDV